jgi:cystathionine gamma-synthase
MNEMSLGPSAPLVPPLFQSSVYVLPDLDALDRIYNGEEPGFTYARDAHPNAHMLAEELARMESATWAVVCGSGMSAISAAVLALVGQGDRVLAGNRLYGRTTQLLMQELIRFGVQAQLVDTDDADQVRQALRQRAKLFIVETMSNPLLRMVDVPALAALCREHECKLLVDNTFATPALLRPLEIGTDLVVESLTKMIGGHSDVTLGVICGRNDLAPQITQVVSIWGLMSNPFECWLAHRSLDTLGLRMRAASANAAALADWLATQPGVRRVVYPGRADHPDHALARRLLGDCFGNMLCFELARGREAVNGFMRGAAGVPFSPSLGHIRTTCSHPFTTSHRYATKSLREGQGITEGLIRLSVGVEPLEQIQSEMAKGLR